MHAASSSHFDGVNSNPDLPSSTSSGMPATRLAITAVPSAIASMRTMGSPSIKLGKTRMSEDAIRSSVSCSPRRPAKVTLPAIPSSSDLERRSSASGPSPTRTNSAAGELAAMRGECFEQPRLTLFGRKSADTDDAFPSRACRNALAAWQEVSRSARRAACSNGRAKRGASPALARSRTRRRRNPPPSIFSREEQPGRVIRFGNAVHREAPRHVEQTSSEIADDGARVSKVVVEPGDASPLQLPRQHERFGEIDERHRETTDARRPMPQCSSQGTEITGGLGEQEQRFARRGSSSAAPEEL